MAASAQRDVDHTGPVLTRAAMVNDQSGFSPAKLTTAVPRQNRFPVSVEATGGVPPPVVTGPAQSFRH